ncbi:MAG: UbiA family prenyltransferase [Thermoplasmata archaeon]|nr:UbiA family prenyltransferase [Thermoplasmata archaeon]
MMATLRDYLQLLRAHTAPLEVLICVIGSAMGSGGLLNLSVLNFSIFGFLYHLTGYGHNSLRDFTGGYDVGDPHKAHHPLQRGVISVERAESVIKILFVLTLGYAVLLTQLKPIPIGILIFAVLMGLIYNIAGKRIHVKFLPIALAHSSLLPFAYFSSGGSSAGTLFLIMLLSFIYLLLQVTYQILIEGDIKDLGVKEAGLLKKLGVELRNGCLRVSRGVKVLGLTIKALSLLSALIVWILMGSDVLTIPYLATFSILLLFFHFKLLKEGLFDHNNALKTMALEEISSIFLLLTVLSPLYHPDYGHLLSLLLIILSMAYFSAMNRVLWGTAVTPKV